MLDESLRDDIRTDLRSLFTGERTIGDSFAAPIIFVAVNAFAGLGAATVAALIAGAAVAGWRVRRGQKVTYALGGIVAIGFAAILALRSGRAESYFLPGIVSAAGWAVAAVISVVVRQPLAAWASSLLRGWPREWYRLDTVRPAYVGVTLIWAGYFAVRASVQWVLYVAGEPEWLAATKIATSWPTIVPLLIVS